MYERADYTGPILDHCDYLIVGSGAAGGTLAWQLAQSGKKVIVVEAGPWVRQANGTILRDMGKTMASYFWDGGMRTTRGNVILPTLQARVLGGGTVFNSAICMRPTPGSLETWRDEHGLTEFTEAYLEPHFQAVEAFFEVKPVTDDIQGQRNLLFKAACDKLGWKSEAIRRNESGCVGSGECILGCRHDAKLSTDRRGIHELVEAGGKVYTSVEVDEVVMTRGRATGIVGHVSGPSAEKLQHVRISAKCVIVAGGAINSALLLQKSGLRAPAIGGNLRFHPSGLMFGIFDQSIAPWSGATQGYHSTQFLEQGIKLESLWATASAFAFRFPGQGTKQFKRYLKKFDRMASWDVWVSGDDSVGEARVLPGGIPNLSFNVGKGDARRLQEGHALLAEMYAAAGATEVLPGLRCLPETLPADEAAKIIREATITPEDLPTASNHVMGTTAMGADPKRHACDSWGKVYGTEDLYVCDTGLYPTSPGVNPQLTAMALAHRLGQELRGRY